MDNHIAAMGSRQRRRSCERLTLSVDQRVVARAKRFAEQRGTSVSKLVERYLDRLTTAPAATPELPVLARLRGLLADADPSDYARHVEEKYR